METEKLTKNLSWADIEKLVEELGFQIEASNFKPDYLVGITVGGLIPLALLAKELNINKMATISVSSYEKDRQGELVILYMPELDLKDKKVLLIDEIADSGKTLKKIVEIMTEKYSPAELKTATVAVNSEKCIFRPDFSVLEDDKWIVFPWEKKDFPEYF